jgi:formylglycine-generating enzyme required for sulfatase activity
LYAHPFRRVRRVGVQITYLVITSYVCSNDLNLLRSRYANFVSVILSTVILLLLGLILVLAFGYRQLGLAPVFWDVSASSLRQGKSFKECASCPEMVVVPRGKFMMGGLAKANEGPQHEVAFGQPFAVSKFAVTTNEWDACVAHGGCQDSHSWLLGVGWDDQVIAVSWNEAKQYASWITKVTGKPYRLVTEAEWEYAAQNGMATGESDWEWVEDRWHENYVGAPTNGSVWVEAAGNWYRVVHQKLTRRDRWLQDYKGNVKFRLARTLIP